MRGWGEGEETHVEERNGITVRRVGLRRPVRRLLQLGDLHLKVRDLVDQVRVLDWVADKVVEHDVQVVVIAGDLAGDPRPYLAKPAERNAALNFMLRLRDSGVHVIVCTGNHDVPQDWAWLDAIPGVTYVQRPETIAFHLLDEPDDVSAVVHVLPHPDRSWIAQGKKTKAEVTEALHHALPTILEGMSAVWAQDRDVPAIVVGHIGTRGCEVREGQPLIGQEVELPVDAIPHSVDVALLNHIHYGQKHGGAVHVGSPWPTRNGEDERKSVALWHVKEKRLERLDTPHMRFETATIQWVSYGHAFKVVDPPKNVDERTRLRVRVVYEEGEDVDFGLVPGVFPLATIRSIDRNPIARRRERAREVVEASGPVEKFLAYELHEGRDVTAQLDDLTRELCGTMGLLGAELGAVAGRDMRLMTVTLTDIGALGTRTLDLTKLPDGPLAVVGPNGSGKTTLCEMSAAGGLWRQLPSRVPAKRGALIELACSRESRVEVVYDYGGRELKAVHMLDAKARTAEATLYLDGVPFGTGTHTSDGKLRTFDACVAAVLPSWEAIAATRFWVQGGGGAWDSLEGTDRRTILRELLGLEGYQRVAGAAKARYEETSTACKEAELQRETLLPSVEQRDRQQAELAELVDDTAALEAQQQLAQHVVDEQRAGVQDAREAAVAQVLRKDVARMVVVREDVDTLAQKARETEPRKDALSGQLAEAIVLEGAAQVAAREAVAQAATWQAQFDALEKVQVGLRGAEARLANATPGEAPRDPDEVRSVLEQRSEELELVRGQASIAQTAAREAAAQTGAYRTQSQLTERAREAMQAAEERFAAYYGGEECSSVDLDGVQHERDEARRVLDVVRETAEADKRANTEIATLTARREEIERRNGMVASIPCGGRGQYEECPLLTDAREVLGDLGKIDDRIMDLRTELCGVGESDVLTASEQLVVMEEALTEAMTKATMVGDVERAREAYNACNVRLATLPAGNDEAIAIADSLDAQERRLSVTIGGLRQELDDARELERLARRAHDFKKREDEARDALADLPQPDSEAIAAAQDATREAERMRDELAVLTSQHDRALERYEALGSELSRLLERDVEGAWERIPDHIKAWDGGTVSDADERLSQARLELSARSRERDQATGQREALRGALDDSANLSERIAGLEFKVERASTIMDNLKRAQHAFGPRGIQAVIVHDAGPAVSDVANQLLDAAYGGLRFRVDLVTVKEKADGSGFKDAIDLTVTNAANGLTCSMDNLSGGERDMVRAALALALALHHSELTGVRWRTAWADEAGAALTQENAHRWMRMLRTASDMLGLRQVLVVTHDPEVQRACDATIDVEQLMNVPQTTPVDAVFVPRPDPPREGDWRSSQWRPDEDDTEDSQGELL